MTTPKQAAALALAEAYVDRVGNPGHACRAQDEYFASSKRIRDAEDAYRAIRHTPSAPDLTAVEREYLEACWDYGVGIEPSGLGRMIPVEKLDRVRTSYRALRAARTRSEPDALEEADRRLDVLAEQMTEFAREDAPISTELLASFANDVGDIQVQIRLALAARKAT